MKPYPDQPDDTKPRHNAHSGSALRTGAHGFYLPPPLDAQARAEMQTWLSPRLQSDPLGALYGYAMEVPARAAGRRPQVSPHFWLRAKLDTTDYAKTV